VLVDNVLFVDIGGIDGHHCLNFLFIINVLPNYNTVKPVLRGHLWDKEKVVL
jgi:hypothetical protein